MHGRIHKHANLRLNSSAKGSKAERLGLFKRFLKLENDMMLRRHRAGESGLSIVKLRSTVIDTLLEHLFKAAMESLRLKGLSAPCPVCMIALGGYGRSELSPLSDIDFMFLYPSDPVDEETKAFQEHLTSEILYPLWDLKLKVGHSTRTINEAVEAAREDIQTKTAMFDSRLIQGSENLFAIFQQAYSNFYLKEAPRDYLEIRLREQALRRERYGGTVFLQEPDIKNGVGGLRDYQNTLWMARVKLGISRVEDLCEHNYLQKKEQMDFVQAYDFLMRVRNDLHFALKRASDQLDLERQPLVAANLGYPQKDLFERVEAFMHDYYRHAQTIFRSSKILEKRLALRTPHGERTRVPLRDLIAARRQERLRKIDGFVLRGKELTFESRDVFKDDPERLVRVFRHCQKLKCGLDFELESLIQESLPLITAKVINSPNANTSFRSIMQDAGVVHPILSQMHELGVLGRFVPEFGRLTCLVQHEYYHRYTADVHTLNAIRELDDVFIAKEPMMKKYRDVLHDLSHPALLYLILLLHDTGKAFGIAGHAKAGVEIAAGALARLQVPWKFRDLVSFVIENHLLMSRFWQKHDIDDPSTVVAFTEQIDDFEKLGCLYVHTFCDARATASGLWTSYKDMLHTTLYRTALEQVAHGGDIARRIEKKRGQVVAELKEGNFPGITPEEIEAHCARMPDRYFLHTEVPAIILHIRMVQAMFANIANAPQNDVLLPVVDWEEDVERSLAIVDIVTWNRTGLFSKLTGAFALAGLNILTAKALARADDIAIDTFDVVEPPCGIVGNQSAKEIFEKSLETTLTSDKDLLPEIRANAAKQSACQWTQDNDFLHANMRQTVDVYHDPSIDRIVVEVQVNDRIGLLYELSRIIYNHGYDILFARIATERGVAIDTFYIERVTGGEASPPELSLHQLQSDLQALIAGDQESPDEDAEPD